MSFYVKKSLIFSTIFLCLLIYFIFNFSPSRIINYVFFALCFLVIYSICSLFYYFLRKIISGDKNEKLAKREGFFTATAGVVILYLGSLGLIWFWDWFLVIIIFILLEIMLLSKKRKLH